jgi:hypothetical protein
LEERWMSSIGLMAVFLAKALPMGIAAHFLYKTLFDAKKNVGC